MVSDGVKAVRGLAERMSAALRSSGALRPEARDYLKAVIRELDSARLERNPQAAPATPPPELWKEAVALERLRRTSASLEPIVALQPELAWFTGERFWPEEEHRHFATRLWGAYFVGREDAAFTAGERYLALLGLLGPHALYPLHQHRMEEAYLVLAGHADWSCDSEEWTALAPGAVFHVLAHEPHSIRTGDETLAFVSFYLPPFDWDGGLVVAPRS